MMTFWEAGGVMIEAAEKGRAVFSVTVTDGRGSPRKGPAISDEEMVERRQKESMAALKVVGRRAGSTSREGVPTWKAKRARKWWRI